MLARITTIVVITIITIIIIITAIIILILLIILVKFVISASPLWIDDHSITARTSASGVYER